METLFQPTALVVVGVLGVIVSGVISAIKGYKWLIAEIRKAITEALEHHTEVEGEWQREIERRLEAIEAKMDKFMAGH